MGKRKWINHPLEDYAGSIDYDGIQPGTVKPRFGFDTAERKQARMRHRERVRMFNLHRGIRRAAEVAVTEITDFVRWLASDDTRA